MSEQETTTPPEVSAPKAKRRKAPKRKPVGVRTKTPVVHGDKTKTRMIRVDVNFATWLVREAEKQTKLKDRAVTVTEITRNLYARLGR